MDTALTELIAVAGTLAGATIGVGGSLFVSRTEKRHSLNTRMRDAFGVYLGALYPVVSELRGLPDVDGIPKTTEIINRIRGESATYVSIRRREREVFGDGLRGRHQAIAIAIADLQVLPLPSDARAAVDISLNYVERLTQRRTPELKAEWTEIHAKLVSAAETLRSR